MCLGSDGGQREGICCLNSVAAARGSTENTVLKSIEQCFFPHGLLNIVNIMVTEGMKENHEHFLDS